MADRVERDGYLLAAWRYGYFEPYLFFEAYDWSTPYFDHALLPSAGLNVHLTAVTQLKLQYLLGRLVESTDWAELGHSTQDIHLAAVRLVVAL
jgi:hypothetical protein